MEAFLKKNVKDTNNDLPLNQKFKNKQIKKSIPWVEKYRPKSVADISCQDEIVAVLKKSIERSDLPSLLFYGPPGTGKTSTIIAAAKDLFGTDLFKERVLELNASDERGIKVIREKVKTFAQHAASSHILPNGKTCPSFKIIILDEADSMTTFAQAALKRIMEKECKTTRFCIICNYLSRIIEPITSRCAKFRFKPLASDSLILKLKDICSQEGVNLENDGVLDFIVEVSEGDMRKAITYLQSAYLFKGLNGQLTTSDICEIAGVIPNEWLTKIILFYQNGKVDDLTSISQDFMLTGWSVVQLVCQLCPHLIHKVDESVMSDVQKAKVLEKLAYTEYCLQDGADEELQLMNLLAYIIDIRDYCCLKFKHCK